MVSHQDAAKGVDLSDVTVRFGHKLRDIRLEKGHFPRGTCRAAGLHRTYVSSVERGERNISLVKIENLARALGVTLAELMPRPLPETGAAELGLKSNREFLRNISIGAVGVRQVARLLSEGGFCIIELERCSMSNKLWKDKDKKRRMPDLLCLKTGTRFEVRAKSGSHGYDVRC